MEKSNNEIILNQEEINVNKYICATFQKVCIDDCNATVPPVVSDFIQAILEEGA